MASFIQQSTTPFHNFQHEEKLCGCREVLYVYSKHLQLSTVHPVTVSQLTVAWQDKTAILGEISPIFCSFSTYFLPMVPHPPTCLRITPISAYYSPIFRLWYPILIIISSICCPFAVFPPTCLRILLIFRLFSACPVLPGGETQSQDAQLRAEDVLNKQKVLLYSHRVFLYAESCEKE